MPALVLTLIFIPIFWLLIIRPQQERQKAHRTLVASLVAGDRVESFSGIHGTLTEVGDQTVQIEVADGVVLTMARLAIAGRLDDEVEDPVAPSDGPIEHGSDPTLGGGA